MPTSKDFLPEKWRGQCSREDLKRLFIVARNLVGVGDGHKARDIIDAVRDAMYSSEGDWPWPSHCHTNIWHAAMQKLHDVAGQPFYAWEFKEGVSHEDRLAFMDRVIAASGDWRKEDAA